MRIWLDPERMAALGVTPAEVSEALRANNFISAAGSVKGDFVETPIRAETSIASTDAFARLVVSTRGVSLIRLGNVAPIEPGPQGGDSASALDGPKAREDMRRGGRERV